MENAKGLSTRIASRTSQRLVFATGSMSTIARARYCGLINPRIDGLGRLKAESATAGPAVVATRLQLTTSMRCPECKTPYEANTAACSSCGLLLLKLAPHRRGGGRSVGKNRPAAHRAPRE